MKSKTNSKATKTQTILDIARKELFFETLDTRSNGSDFQEVSVWCVKAALEAAYEAGRNSK